MNKTNMTKNIQTCSRCVMNTTDPNIVFDDNGMCNHCKNFDENAYKIWMPNKKGKKVLDRIIDDIKNKNKNKDFDCIMGLSGGLDSSFLALKLKEYGLRTLVVHVDAGWNSELAVNNIEKIVNHCNYELYTHVVNWESIKNLQVAYLKSGIANQDVPQDHVFFAVLYKEAIKRKCKTFMSGGNVSTEFITPSSWHGSAMDSINIYDIFKKHGKGSLKGYTTISFLDWAIMYRVRGFKQIRPLNYMPFNPDSAINELSKAGWRNYSRKHGESIFTKFFQNYFLPKRFGYDKRILHYSSRILSKDMTREQALAGLSRPLYDNNELENDIDYVCKKLLISRDDLDNYLSIPKKSYDEYKNWNSRYSFFRKIYNFSK